MVSLHLIIRQSSQLSPLSSTLIEIKLLRQQKQTQWYLLSSSYSPL